MPLKNTRQSDDALVRTNINDSDEGATKSVTPITMGDIHGRIHEGILYTFSKVLLGVLDNAYLDVLIRVAADSEAHIRPALAAGGEAHFSLYENTTFTVEGTALVAVNRNRESPNVASTVFKFTPTIDAVGDLLLEGIQPGGSGGNASGGKDEADFEEWILTPGDYVFRIQNLGGAAKNLSAILDFYEPHG